MTREDIFSTVLLDGSVRAEQLNQLIDISFDLTKTKMKQAPTEP